MTVQQIIIQYFREGKSQRKIARELNIHRRTVKKHIEQYQNILQNGKGEVLIPNYQIAGRKKVKMTDAVMAAINELLKINEQRISQGMHKQQLKVIDIFEQLQADGFDIGYTSVCNYIRNKKKRGSEKFIKQHYRLGEVSEFDWGTVKLNIGNQLHKYKMGIFTLAYSNHRFAMLFKNEQMNSVLEAHTHYFDFIGGVPACIVYDNMKTAVAKFTYKQKDKKPTEDLVKIATYYAFNYRFTNAAKGNEKGHVERSVEYIRRKCFASKIDFENLHQANAYLIEKLKVLNQKTSSTQSEKSIAQLFLEEQKSFKALPLTAYQTAIFKTCAINKYHTICYGSNFYSVPEDHPQKQIDIKIYSDKLMMYNTRNQIIASHKRCYAKNKWIININHYLFTLSTKPGALPCSYALKQAPQMLQNIYQKHYKNDNKAFIKTAMECNKKGYDLNSWMQAIELYKSKTSNPITTSIVVATMDQIQRKVPQNEVQNSLLNQQIAKAANQQLKQLQQIF